MCVCVSDSCGYCSARHDACSAPPPQTTCEFLHHHKNTYDSGLTSDQPLPRSPRSTRGGGGIKPEPALTCPHPLSLSAPSHGLECGKSVEGMWRQRWLFSLSSGAWKTRQTSSPLTSSLTFSLCIPLSCPPSGPGHCQVQSSSAVLFSEARVVFKTNLEKETVKSQFPLF